MTNDQLKKVMALFSDGKVEKLSAEEKERMKKENREKIINEPVVVDALKKLAREQNTLNRYRKILAIIIISQDFYLFSYKKT